MADGAPVTPGSDSPLDYAPRTSRKRRGWAWAVLLTLLAALALGAWVRRRELGGLVNQGRLLYAQHRCLTFDPPPDRVAYEDDPAKAQRMLQDDPVKVQAMLPDRDYFFPAAPGGKPLAALYWPRVYRDWPEASRYHLWSTPAVLFMHEMKMPAGDRLLVYVVAEYDPKFSDSLLVRVQAVDPATWQKASSPSYGLVTRMVKPPADREPYQPNRTCSVRVYAGRVDPADPSHFSIPYEGSGHRGVMEGRLQDTRNGGEGIDLQFRRIIEPAG
jgi:hypothetical protein